MEINIYVLWLCLMKKLIRNLERFKNNYTFKSNNWTPHASILVAKPENILKGIPIVNDNFKPICGRIVSLSLCEFSPMRAIKTFDLK